jgi:hypothetical protein
MVKTTKQVRIDWDFHGIFMGFAGCRRFPAAFSGTSTFFPGEVNRSRGWNRTLLGRVSDLAKKQPGGNWHKCETTYGFPEKTWTHLVGVKHLYVNVYILFNYRIFRLLLVTSAIFRVGICTLLQQVAPNHAKVQPLSGRQRWPREHPCDSSMLNKT